MYGKAKMVERQFGLTPWRSTEELLELRKWFYGGVGEDGVDRRRRGVDLVCFFFAHIPVVFSLLFSVHLIYLECEVDISMSD